MSNNLLQFRGYVGQFNAKRLKAISAKRKISVSRLIGFAIDKELLQEVPFEYFADIPEIDIGEEDYTYADECGKILEFIKTLRNGAALDILCLMRYDIGIPDKDRFLEAFADCINKGLLESFVPTGKFSVSYPEDYLFYRITGSKKEARRQRRKEADYDKFLRLKKKFEKEGEL